MTSPIGISRIFLSIIIWVVIILPRQTYAQIKNDSIHKDSFKEVFKEFPRQEKNLRKWDSPVVADLDQDGYLDLLINDHGLGVQVQWNNKGKFAKPFDIIMGDIHGVSVGDLDGDHRLEIIMSRGGGSGSNARNSKLFRVTKNRMFIPLGDFKEPLPLMRGRTVAFFDGDNDGDLDLLNFAFPDAKKKGESENYIHVNDGNGELTIHSTLPKIKQNGQKTLLTDFNNDHILDIIKYGNGSVKAYQGDGNLSYVDVSNEIFPEAINNVTAIVELDFDNDGDFDLFLTRGKEFNIGETFYDKESQTLGFFTKRGEFVFDNIAVGDVLELENFQSQWPNNDTYFIGEASYAYQFSGETHSGKNIRLVNSDALGFPDNANFKEKKGWYIGYTGNRKWRIAGFLWAPATGIIHGVNDYPSVKHSKPLSNLLLENKGEKFKNVTKEFHLSNPNHSMATTVADLDNNGYQDILVIQRGDLVSKNEVTVYLNQQGTHFKPLNKHGIISTELGAIGMAVETIDYDHDGNVDVVVGNERGKWHLFKNELHKPTNNNYVTFNIGRSPKNNTSPLGALVKIELCDGSKPVQRVGSTGAQYSFSHNTYVHFGLNQCRSLKVKVQWSNGETKSLELSTVNKAVKIGN